MEADPTSERLTDAAPQQEEPQRSAWELIDEEWEEGEMVPMCR